MKKLIYCCMLILIFKKAACQPYLDILRIQYMHSPNTGIFNRDKNSYQISLLNTSINIPLKCKPIHGVAILSPFYEQWRNELNDNSIPVSYYQHFGMAVTILDTVTHHKIRLAVSPVVRCKNFSEEGTSTAQWGLAGLAIFQFKKITFKTGLYFNKEYFGDFFVPLFGIDCQLSKADKLFGTLPGNMVWEHRVQKGWYYGIKFQAITNSFRDLGNQYWRIDDNQLGCYSDISISKHLVLNIELGHSFFRKIRIGEKNVFIKDLSVNDNLYFQLGTSYRIRF